MGTITRGTKASGGTNFAANTTALNDEVDLDFNTMYTEFNGNIEDVNVSATAGIGASKIDDHSDDAATSNTTSDPGATGSEMLAASMEDELEQLRFILHSIGWGRLTGTNWRDEPLANLNQLGFPNILQNGGFESYNVAANQAPPGWTLVGTPTTVAQIDSATTAADVDGPGASIHIVPSVDNEGIQQQIPAAGLRASSTYRVRVRAKATGVGTPTMRLLTTGATTNIDETSTSTSWATLEGTFTTDATPAAVTVQLLVNDPGGGVGEGHFDRCVVRPTVSTRAIDQGPVVTVQRGNTAGTALTTVLANWTIGASALDETIVIPGPGYMIRVSAVLNSTSSTTATPNNLLANLDEDVDGGGFSTVASAASGIRVAVTSTFQSNIHLQYTLLNPTPGSRYRYRVQGQVNGAGVTYTPQSIGPGGNSYSELRVEAVPHGN